MRKIVLLLILLTALVYIVYAQEEAVIVVKPDRVYALEPVKITIVVKIGDKPVKNAVIKIRPETGGLTINGSKEITLTTDEKGEAKAVIVVNRCGVLEISAEGGEPSVEASIYVFVFFRKPPLIDYAAVVLDALLILLPLFFFLYIGPIRASRRAYVEH